MAQILQSSFFAKINTFVKPTNKAFSIICIEMPTGHIRKLGGDGLKFSINESANNFHSNSGLVATHN